MTKRFVVWMWKMRYWTLATIVFSVLASSAGMAWWQQWIVIFFYVLTSKT